MAGRPFVLLVSIVAGCADLPDVAPQARHLPSPLAAATAVAGAGGGSVPAAPLPWPAELRRPTGSAQGARVYSKVRFLWIRPRPSEAADWLGYLSLGDSAPLAGGSLEAAAAGPGSGSGCSRWVAIEPRGYVCLGEHATTDTADPDVVELRRRRAKHEPLPYDYGESLGTTVYLDVPPLRRQRFREAAFAEHMAAVEQARRATSPEQLAAQQPALDGKFHTATMTSNFSEKVVHSEVPYTQTFSGPYALHVAYWHDEWGVGKSGGCVNLSPIDGQRLFAWTDPPLPSGWHGMRAVEADRGHHATATVVSLHR